MGNWCPRLELLRLELSRPSGNRGSLEIHCCFARQMVEVLGKMCLYEVFTSVLRCRNKHAGLRAIFDAQLVVLLLGTLTELTSSVSLGYRNFENRSDLYVV